MNAQRYRRIQELFLAARRHPPGERAPFLLEACAGDHVLHAEVDKLLSHDDSSFLEDRNLETGQTTPRPGPARPGERIGPYLVEDLIGEGGFGAVYRAEQLEPVRRHVALKILKRGLETDRVLARFESERQVLALLDHPFIAKVFDAGATDSGCSYFAMEHVGGLPITDYCDAHRLRTGERLRLFLAVCAAIQHAHQKAIIHRDIKPSNVLVSAVDGKPQPKVIDFGIAKAVDRRLTEGALTTEEGQIVGTPAYMSPEQADGHGLDVDTRSDVYSLGVLVYELLVSEPPFVAGTFRRVGLAELQRLLEKEQPPSPSARIRTLGEKCTTVAANRRSDLRSLRRELRGDLDWIVMKALDKDPARRYQTVSELAADIERFLRHEPVFARPPGVLYRLSKLIRRHRFGFAAGAALFVALVAGVSTTWWQAARARDQRDRALGLQREAKTQAAIAQAINEFFDRVLTSAGRDTTGREVTVRQMLARAAERIEGGFPERPEIEAAIQATIGKSYCSLGRFREGRAHLARVAELRRRTHGEEDPRTLLAQQDLVEVMAQCAEFAEAEPIQRRVVEAFLDRYGETHERSLTAMNTLAGLLLKMGRYEECALDLERLLGLCRRVLGEDHERTLVVMNHLGVALSNVGRLDDADALLRQALQKCRRVFAEAEYWVTLEVMNTLGTVLGQKGENDEAEQLFRKLLDMRLRIKGEQHAATVGTMHNLAAVLRARGRLGEAQELLERALAAGESELDDAHPTILQLRCTLGGVLLQRGALEAAESQLRATLKIQRGKFGEAHQSTLQTMHMLTVLCRRAGRLEQAEKECRRVVEIAERGLGPLHLWTISFRHAWGDCLGALGRYQDAEVQLLRSAKELEKTGAPRKVRSDVARTLAQLYETWGKPREAERYRVKRDRVRR